MTIAAGRLRAVALGLLTLSLFCLATAHLRTGDTALGVELQNVLDEIRVGQRHFAETCGHGGYAASIAQLSVVLADFNDGFLKDAIENLPGHLEGIAVVLEASFGAPAGPLDCMNRPTTMTYYASATYRWSYWKGPAVAMSTDGVIWQSPTAEPPRYPFGAPAIPIAR